MSAAPATTTASREGPSVALPLLLGVIGYFGLLAAAEVLARRVVAFGSPALQHLAPDRRDYLVNLVVPEQVMLHLALMAMPMVLIGLVARIGRDRNALGELGVNSDHSVASVAVGLTFGVLLHLTVILAATAGSEVSTDLGRVGPAMLTVLVAGVVQRLVAEPLAALVILLLIGLNAVARVFLPFGHILPLLRERLDPRLAALLVAVVFAAGYLNNPVATPLALLNMLLLGLLLERLRVSSGGLLSPLCMFSGWLLVAEFSVLPAQGIQPHGQLLRIDNAWLGGGAFGPDGGLAMTLVASLCLTWLAGWEFVRNTRREQPNG